jgi:hypothetical protein
VGKPTQAQKDAAERSQDKAQTGAELSGAASFGVAFIPGPGPFIGGGILIFGLVLGRRARKQAKIVKDPPRDDYDQTTVLRPLVFSPRALGDSTVEEVAVRAAGIQDRLAQIIDAMVIAIERASGAELAGKFAMAEARTAEALHFAEMLSSRLLASSEAIGELHNALAEYSGPVKVPGSMRLSRALGDDVTAQLEAMGVSSDDLAMSIETLPDDPVGDFGSAIAETAEADYAFATVIQRALSDGTLLEPEAGTGTSTAS